MKDLKAVIFDMDGLMLDSERMAIKSLQRAGTSIGLDFTESMLMGCIGLNAKSSNIFLTKAVGKSFDDAALSNAFYADYEASLARDGVPIKAGLLELLEFLKRSSIRLAVATSTATALAEKKLSRVGVSHYFEFVVGGDAVAEGKPAPDPYLKAAMRLGLDVGHCLALEDSDNGARSALAARMDVIIVPDIKQPEEKLCKQALACLPSLHHVKDYLALSLSAGSDGPQA